MILKTKQEFHRDLTEYMSLHKGCSLDEFQKHVTNFIKKTEGMYDNY